MSSQFKAEVFQNQFLPEGAKEVHAIMTVTVVGGEGVTATPCGAKLFGGHLRHLRLDARSTPAKRQTR